MARAVHFPEVNGRYRPPEGQEDDVYTLDVHAKDNVITSCWQLSADEVAEIVLTGRVWLQVQSDGPFYPSLVRGDNPFRK